MNQNSKLTAVTMSLPSRYERGLMEVDEPKAGRLLQEAYEKGIRNFSTAPQYLMGKCEEFIGKILSPVRKEITLSTNFPFYDPSLPKENPVLHGLNKSMEAHHTDYIDCLNFYGHFIDPIWLQEAESLREAGIIKHVGVILEPHNLIHIESILENAASAVDTVIVFFLPVIPGQLEALSVLKKNGIRIVAGGLLDIGSDSLPIDLPGITGGLENISATEIATRYFLKQEVFDEVIFNLTDPDYLHLVRECEKSLDKYSFSQLEPYFQKAEISPDRPKILCSSCGYCMPCPKGIDIPRVFNMYAYYEQYGMVSCAAHTFSSYQNRLGDRIAELCTNCGLCEKRCTHQVPVSSNLKELEDFMERLPVFTTSL